MPALRADVAQLVEQRIRNAKVASSIPAIGTSKSRGWLDGLPLFLWGGGVMLQDCRKAGVSSPVRAEVICLRLVW